MVTSADRKMDLGFLPYITLTEPIQFGDIVLWPYHKSKQDFIGHIPGAVEHNDAIAGLFTRFYDGEKIESIVAVSFADKRLTFSPQDMEDILDAVHLLAYSGLSQRNIVRFYTFESFLVNFYTTNLDKTSGVLNLTSRFGTWHMMDVQTTKFQSPFYISIQSADNLVKSDFLKLLMTLYDKSRSKLLEKDEKDEAQRIIRAISWYNQSYYANPLISNYVALISLAVSLETLLNIQDFSRKAKELSNAIQLLLGDSSLTKQWALSFYDVRSKILHGEKVDSLQYGVAKHSSHLVLAQIVFDYCLKTKLRLINKSVQIDPFDLLLWKPLSYYLVSNKERIDEILSYKFDELRDQKKLLAFKKLSYTLNDETDFSGDQAFFKSAIVAIAKLGQEGLNRIEAKKSDYLTVIPKFGEELQEHKDIFTKIINGDLESIKQLSYVETSWPSPDGVNINHVKFLELIDGLPLSDINYLLSKLMDIWEHKAWQR